MVPIFLLMNRMASRRKLLSTTAKPRAYKKDPGRRGEFCRTCLSTKNLECIFADMECEENRSEELRVVTGLDIKLNDGLSQKICIRCNRTINATLRLRRVSRKTERILIKMTVKNKKVKPRRKIPRATKIEKELNSSDVNIDVEGSMFDYEDYDYDLEFPEHFESKLQEDMQREESEVEIERPVRRQRSETPATSYKCNICGKEFRMKATYKAHERFHTNYCVCEVCGKRCRNNNQLQEHKRARHGLGRIHKCAYCEYSSATKEALVIHERRHTGERPYVCDHCGASFYRRSTLVQHIAIHLPEKNFQCDMCPKRLKSKKFLQIHKHNAHTGKRYGYLCSVCDHRFEKPNKVRAHTRRVHGLPDDQQGPIVRVIL